MVRVGEIFWVAKVRGAGKASETAQTLQSDLGEVEKSASDAAESQNRFGSASEDSADSLDGLMSTSGDFRTESSLLSGGLDILSSRLANLAATSTLVSGAFSLASKAVAGFRLATAGLGLGTLLPGGGGKAKKYGRRIGGLVLTGFKTATAGLGKIAVAGLTSGPAVMTGAIGAGLVIGGLVVRGLQKAGVMDFFEGLGNSIRETIGGGVSDAILRLSSPVAAPFAAFGGFVNGFMSRVFKDGIRAGIKEGLDESERVLESFPMFDNLGESEPVNPKNQIYGKETAAPTAGPGGGLSDETFQEYQESLENPPSSGPGKDVTSPGDVSGPPIEIPESEIPPGISDASELVEETDIEDQLDLSEEAAKARIQIVGAAMGGMVAETGTAVIHKGEAVIPEPLVSAAERGRSALDERRESTEIVVEDSRDSPTEVTNNYNITIGDQSLDLSTLSGRELRELADTVGEELGSRSGTKTGGVQ